jgi:hypothetical protein
VAAVELGFWDKGLMALVARFLRAAAVDQVEQREQMPVTVVFLGAAVLLVME